MKRCEGCKRSLEKIHFSRNKTREDGLNAKCKDCDREYRIKTGRQKPEGWKRKTENMEEYRKKWSKEHPGYWSKVKKKWLKKNRVRDLVRQKVKYALKTGKLVKGPCVKCGDLDVDGHHEDYSKPLEVIWLCKFHHREVHRNGKA